jgi:transposase
MLSTVRSPSPRPIIESDRADINQEGQEGSGWRDRDISDALGISVSTIERVRQRFVEHRVEAALSRQTPIRTKPGLLDGEQEAHLIALACAETPEGQGKWTVRLLDGYLCIIC